MTYDVIKHLSAIDILKEEVKMTLSDDKVPHFANIRVSKQGDDRCLANSANLPILIFWPCRSLCPS